MFINSILCQDPATFISEIGSSTDMTQSIFEAHLLLTAKRDILFGLDKVHARQSFDTRLDSVFTAFNSFMQKNAKTFDICLIQPLFTALFFLLTFNSFPVLSTGEGPPVAAERSVASERGKRRANRLWCASSWADVFVSKYLKIMRDPFFSFVLHCDLRDLPPLHTTTYHYILLHTITTSNSYPCRADFFHLLFRDKILDLTAAFPADARIIDPDTKQEGTASQSWGWDHVFLSNLV